MPQKKSETLEKIFPPIAGFALFIFVSWGIGHLKKSDSHSTAYVSAILLDVPIVQEMFKEELVNLLKNSAKNGPSFSKLKLAEQFIKEKNEKEANYYLQILSDEGVSAC